ncbi:MAG: hypothetical protein IJA07_07380 [Agathobacter sp.]|nr:hypothetical protein [Agathobacter sp.]
MKRIINGTFIGVIVLFLLVGFVKTLFFPEDISEAENRYANKITSFTMEEFLDGSFQEQVKDALSDQVPLSTTMKKLYNFANSFFEKELLVYTLGGQDNRYMSYRGSLLFGDHLVYATRNFEDEKPLLDKKIENVKYQAEKNKDIDFYMYYLECDTDIYFETKEKLGAYEYLENQCDLMNISYTGLKINSYQDYKNYFYKTDHHWNCYGSYKAYEDLVKLMKIEEPLVSIKEEYLLDCNFSGSKAIAVGANGIYTEKFPAYLYEFPEMIITINDQWVEDYGAQENYINGELTGLSYATFYGNDHGKVVLDTGNENKENILIIGNSYDNANLKLIASHFNQTHSIDLRHYENTYGEKFSFSNYVKEHNIDKVLLIGGLDYFVSEVFMLED